MSDKKIVYPPKFFSGQSKGSRNSANVVVPILMALLHPETVIDIGCGVGAWLAEFKAAGVSVTGVDGEYCKDAELLIPEHHYVFDDLVSCCMTGEIKGIESRFSLCLSLEVAEHLPEQCADGFVSLLTRLSDVVVFSAAIPHQGGRGHINEQWLPYWIKKFRRHGYVPCDVVRPLIWNNSEVQPWYRQNMLVYFKETAYRKVEKRINEIILLPTKSDEYLSRVHPDFFLLSVEYFHSEDFLITIEAHTFFSVLFKKSYKQCRRILGCAIKKFQKLYK